jgi:hypothetical protein
VVGGLPGRRRDAQAVGSHLEGHCQDFDAITAINVGSDMDLSAILLSDIVAQRISGADI